MQHVFLALPLLVCFAFGRPSAEAHANLPLRMVPGQWQFFVHEKSYLTTGNFTNSGHLASLYGSDSFSTHHVMPGLRIDATRRWSLYGWLDLGSSESLSQLVRRSETNLSEVVMGSDYRLLGGANNLTFRLQGTIPLRQYLYNTDDVFLGEGAYQVLSELFLAKKMSWAVFIAHLGFHYRSEGLSALLPWGFGLLRDFSQWRIATELWGYESVIDDQYVLTPATRTQVSERVNGGSFYYHAVNPALMALGVQVEYFWTPHFSMNLGYNGLLNGFRTGAGHVISFGINVRTDPTSHPVNDQRPHDDGFVPDPVLDRADMQLFDGRRDTTEEDLDIIQKQIEKK